MSDKPKKTSQAAPEGVFRAFTVKASGPMLSIRFSIGITLPVAGPDGRPDSEIKSFMGVVNTGRPTTQINKRVAEELGIPLTILRGHEVYLIDLYMPNRIRFSGVPTTLIDDPNKDCVIGMDILACGDIAISNAERKTTFSFRVPPGKVVDFVEEHGRQAPQKSAAHQVKANPVTIVDRNQLCVCGSGKKYKSCCGKYQH